MSPPATRETGRRVGPGAGRHRAILEATVRVLIRDGLAGVTHRAVAREAEVPLAATTYYFSSKEELLGEALTLMAEDEITRLGQRAAEMGEGLSSPADSAAALAEVLFPTPTPPARCSPSSRSSSTPPGVRPCASRGCTGRTPTPIWRR